MIDITVDNNEVVIEFKCYHPLTDKDELVALITELLNKAKYSGESMLLHRVEDDGRLKRVIERW